MRRIIPICFYDPILQEVRAYSYDEQLLDYFKLRLEKFSTTESKPKPSHVIFCKAVMSIRGSAGDQLEQFFFLVTAYLESPLHQGFFSNDLFYQTLLEFHHQRAKALSALPSDELKEKAYSAALKATKEFCVSSSKHEKFKTLIDPYEKLLGKKEKLEEKRYSPR